jgi:hypothetical protein
MYTRPACSRYCEMVFPGIGSDGLRSATVLQEIDF